MKTFLELEEGLFINQCLIVDVDGTLVADNHADISDNELQKLKVLAQNNEIYLCSNGSHENARLTAAKAGVKYFSGNKPFLGDWKGISPSYSRCVVIGDKYSTDGLFAVRIGADFCKVRRIVSSTDSFKTKSVYFADDILWKISGYLKIMRPWQWIKNLLVIAPVFFAGTFFSLHSLLGACEAALLFSIVSSFLYIQNDISDRVEDSSHPIKAKRPLPAGRISLSEAISLSVVLLGASLWGMFRFPQLIPLLGTYVFLNILYSRMLKRVAVLDVVLVASFYVMRVVAGGIATATHISPWIMLCTFFGSLFVIVGKRRGEYSRENRRKVLDQYSAQFLDILLGISAALSVIAYGIYSIIGHDSPHLVYSTAFVAVAIFRMLNRICTAPHEAETPELLVFKDVWILGSFLAWAVFVAWVFY